MNTRISPAQWAKAFLGLLETHPATEVVKTFARELSDRRQTRLTESILAQIPRQVLLQKGLLLAEVVSAHPLPPETVQSVTELLRERTGAREVQVETRLDPKLIGGLIVRTSGLELDASVASKLHRLPTVWKNSPSHA